eukprot:gnl/TRDRNA2_/TRDRNA2_38925_c0_seq1.p1 gnl/TRDRNA2_/TRDRNA2_38925_c0~~gnl/TRDRNA2_/TRDRNA2_38925_c0_seq1.p1  ORF type:complete len:189 (+),score=24.35 gnl/TRDRNA2_/TRDRNA2_38925_c0_seq1:83-649(+)
MMPTVSVPSHAAVARIHTDSLAATSMEVIGPFVVLLLHTLALFATLLLVLSLARRAADAQPKSREEQARRQHIQETAAAVSSVSELVSEFVALSVKPEAKEPEEEPAASTKVAPTTAPCSCSSEHSWGCAQHRVYSSPLLLVHRELSRGPPGLLCASEEAQTMIRTSDVAALSNRESRLRTTSSSQVV